MQQNKVLVMQYQRVLFIQTYNLKINYLFNDKAPCWDQQFPLKEAKSFHKHSSERDSSPQNVNSVIIYSPTCYFFP